MRKLLLGALLLLSKLSFSQTVFSENFDNIGYGTPYQNVYPVTYSGDYFLQSSSTGDGWNHVNQMPADYPAATGGNYIRLITYGAESNNQYITINNINTLNLNSLKFAMRKGIADTSGVLPSSVNLIVEQSIDGVNYTQINYIQPPKNLWVMAITITNIISSSNLSLRFRLVPNSPMTNDTYNILLDDISLSYTNLSTSENTLTKLNLYPNPTTGSLYLSTNTDKNIKIYDMIGNLVVDKDVTNFLDTSNLSTGVYLCEIKEGDNKLAKKIVKR